ncbi:MAG: PaaI family thioesterase [Pseudomonadota bacterium]
MLPEDLDPALPWRSVQGTGFNSLVGPFEIARDGDAWIARLTLEDRHINVGGVCHGGVLMTMADIAMGTATFEAGERHPCATIEMDCHFLAAAKHGQTMLCEARQLRRARSLSFMGCTIWSGGRQVLRGSGIWKYLDSRGPGQSGPLPPP